MNIETIESRVKASDQDPLADDLSALVGRLAKALNKAAPTHTLPALAMDYLKRKDLLTNPMRSKFLGDSVDAAYDTFQAAVAQPILDHNNPVAWAVPCAYATCDGKLNGQYVTLVLAHDYAKEIGIPLYLRQDKQDDTDYTPPDPVRHS